MPLLSLLVDTFLFIVVLAVYAYLRKQFSPQNPVHRFFRFLFYTIILLIVVNVVIHISCEFDVLHKLTMVFAILGAVFVPLISVIWMFFIWSIAKCQLKAVFLNIISATILLINLSFAIFSIIPGYTVYFDFLESLPKIGPAFLFYGILTIIPFAIAALIIIIRWRYLQRLVHPEIMFLVNFLPVLGVIGQALSVDFTITITSLILTFIISALGLQHHFVVTDYLTGLYNRRRLIQKLNEKINKTRKNGFFAGYMIDLNDFKKLNDEQGHKAGDAVLREFAEILMSISDNSDLVSRFGGDEFVVIRTLKSPDELKDYKHKLIEAINTYNALPTTNQTVTLSIGCRIFYKDQDSTAEQFLNIIDKAMYENKKQRKLIEQAVGCEVEN